MDEIRPRIESVLLKLSDPPTLVCQKCGVPIPELVVWVADVDQAFEACVATRVGPAFDLFSEIYQQQHSRNQQ